MNRKVDIPTGRNTTVSMECADTGLRVLSFIIDLLAMALIAILFFMVMVLAVALEYDTPSYVVSILMVVGIIATFSLFMEILTGGRSIGKKILGIKVIKLNGEPMNFMDYLSRWIFKLPDIWLSSGSVATISIYASPFSQRLGDMIAGTTVVKLKNSGILSLPALLSLKSDIGREPLHVGMVRLNDEEVLVIKNTLQRWEASPSQGHKEAVELLFDKVYYDVLNNPSQPSLDIHEKCHLLRDMVADFVLLTR
jgi:uncharacterized RDD family membrane protein YckC